jgi:nitroreductase
METLEAIEKRRSCRKYSTEEVDKEMVGMILNAGRLAPSAGNLQDRSFILVKNKTTRLSIAEVCGGQMWMQFAPVHIVVISENKKLSKFYGEKGTNLYAIQDCALAIENMCLTATDLGLGSCIIGAFDDNKLKNILGIPDQATIQAVITIGHCSETPKITPKYDLEKVTWIEKYGSRIENIAVTIGIWSDLWTQQIAKAKEKLKVEEKTGAVKERIKLFGVKAKEKLKKLKKSE